VEQAVTDVVELLAMAIAAVASGRIEVAREMVAAAQIRLQGDQQGELPGIDVPAPRAENNRAAAVRLFTYWQERCNHRSAKLTPERATCIMARLRDGYSEGEIRKAIDGAATAAFVSESGQRFDDITLVCRNGSKLESFIERGIKASGAIAVEVGESSPIEEQISELRRQMSAYRKDGRATEYEHAAQELHKLMIKRGK
jgi:hypothetical protein